MPESLLKSKSLGRILRRRRAQSPFDGKTAADAKREDDEAGKNKKTKNKENSTEGYRSERNRLRIYETPFALHPLTREAVCSLQDVVSLFPYPYAPASKSREKEAGEEEKREKKEIKVMRA